MSDFAIQVEGLGKQYLLRHQAQGRRYVALRDVLADKTVGTVRRLFSGFKSQASGLNRPKSVEEFWALRDVSFEVKQGEAVGIIGRNGAGKSTLLKLLSRISEPTTGRIRLRGRVASLLEVGTGFHPELTGRENIFLNGAILGMHRAEIKSKFDEIVAFAEVEKFLDTPVKRYSSGMYMRLAFAVAAHLEPEILVVDEVLAVGDAAFQKKCLGKMQDVSKNEGRTVLFVSHNMGAVTTLCRTGIWLQQGQVVKSGPARQIVDDYLTINASSQTAVMDLDSRPRLGELGRKLKIERMEWLSGLPLQHGEKVTARIHYRTTDAVEDVSIGIGFATLEGVRLLTYETDFQDGSRQSLPGKAQGYVDVNIGELPLAPGLYSLDIGARSGDGFALDYLGGFAQADIVMGLKTPGTIVRTGAGVRLSSAWQWQFSETPASVAGPFSQPRT
jgi:lipopolysaccharide transport system ATP-binding protein